MGVYGCILCGVIANSGGGKMAQWKRCNGGPKTGSKTGYEEARAMVLLAVEEEKQEEEEQEQEEQEDQEEDEDVDEEEERT